MNSKLYNNITLAIAGSGHFIYVLKLRLPLTFDFETLIMDFPHIGCSIILYLNYIINNYFPSIWWTDMSDVVRGSLSF